MVSISVWVGLTLPGMIELPGSLVGSTSSPMPERGPLPSRRMSLAIFVSATASVPSVARQLHQRIVRGERLELVRRGAEGDTGQAGDLRDDGGIEPGGALSPVPTAVPPCASSSSSFSQTHSSRARQRCSCAA